MDDLVFAGGRDYEVYCFSTNHDYYYEQMEAFYSLNSYWMPSTAYQVGVLMG